MSTHDLSSGIDKAKPLMNSRKSHRSGQSDRTLPDGRGSDGVTPIVGGIDGPWLTSFRDRLRRWHRRNGRDLPWRGADAYRVWVSEIMLQQTTVAAVIPYFERFLTAFPDVTALAAAREEQVLRLWEGLGYYSRARNLHRAAQQIVARHGGELPRDVDELQSLPGIGRYTAGAIASFAYDQRAPIVEANTLRLYARLLNFEGDPRSAAGQGQLWAFAAAVLPRTKVGDFNQALMDLGATVCIPDEPRCEQCPVVSLCGAYAAGRQRELPRPARRPELTDVTECAVVIAHRRKFLLRRCSPGERWAGLWDFPRFAVSEPQEDDSGTHRDRDAPPPWLVTAAAEGVARITGVRPVITHRLGELRHGVTRYRIRLLCLQGEAAVARLPRGAADVRWVAAAELSALPLSTTGREIVRRWIEK